MHARDRTINTLARSTQSRARASCTTYSCRGSSQTPLPALVSGYRVASASTTPSISSCARSSEIFGRIRPSTCRKLEPRSWTAVLVATGSHRSASSVGKENSAGMTPITVYTWSSSRTPAPIIECSPAKRRCHSRWLRIASRAPRRVSSSVKTRPSRGAVPSILNSEAVTNEPWTRSGSPAPRSVMGFALL